MGTYVTVKVSAQHKTEIQRREAVNKAFLEIARIENLLSNFKTGNIIDTINNAGPTEVLLDDETFYILEKAKYFYEISGGAFDITVKPLLELWGFHDRRGGVTPPLPSNAAIKEALKRIGSDKMILDREKKSVRFLVEGMKIDLGGIAKGYAADKTIEVLKNNGIENALVACAGDIRAIGKRGKGKKWSIGIRDPRRKDKIIKQLELGDSAISTSGSYERFFEAGGKRYGHIIDPRTGAPVGNDLLSATIIAKDSVTADALATAVFVLGKEKGAELVSRLADVQVTLVDR